jgi:hypothetical protein
MVERVVNKGAWKRGGVRVDGSGHDGPNGQDRQVSELMDQLSE